MTQESLKSLEAGSMTEKVVPLREHSSWKQDVGGLAERLRIELAAISNVYADDLAGYVVVTVNSKGEWSCMWKADDASPIGRVMLGGLATAAVQREMLADGAAVDAMVRNGLLREPES
jgi:hypothetical protein